MGVSMASTSLAHTYGNVTAFMTEYVKFLLPDYFNTVHVTSSIAFRQVGKLNLNKSPGVFKKSKPILVVAPNLEIDSDDLFLGRTWFTQRLTDQHLTHDGSNLQPFIRDEKSQYSIEYLLNRVKMTFNFTIICETQMEQHNIVGYLKNRVRQNSPFFLTTYLESQLPRTMMETLQKITPMPIHDEQGSVNTFVKYLNGVSNDPITYKMKTSSGNEEFFRYYSTNLLTSFNDLDFDQGSKKGHIYDQFTITFRMPVDFNAAGLYYLFHNSEKVDVEIMKTDYKSFGDNGADKVVCEPLFTVHRLYDIELPQGWTVYATSVFKVSKEMGDVDEVDLTCLHNQSMIEFIREFNSRGMPISPFIKVYLLKDSKMLTEGEDYKLSADTTLLSLYNLNPKSSYRVVIHSNTEYINEAMKDKYNLDSKW